AHAVEVDALRLRGGVEVAREIRGPGGYHGPALAGQFLHTVGHLSAAGVCLTSNPHGIVKQVRRVIRELTARAWGLVEERVEAAREARVTISQLRAWDCTQDTRAEIRLLRDDVFELIDLAALRQKIARPFAAPPAGFDPREQLGDELVGA